MSELVHIRINDQQHQQLMKLAQTQGTTVSAIVREALTEFLKPEFAYEQPVEQPVEQKLSKSGKHYHRYKENTSQMVNGHKVITSRICDGCGEITTP